MILKICIRRISPHRIYRSADTEIQSSESGSGFGGNLLKWGGGEHQDSGGGVRRSSEL